jgi:hypothetical protein
MAGGILFFSPICPNHVVGKIKSGRYNWLDIELGWDRQEVRTAYLVGKHFGRSPLERSRRKWKGNVKMSFMEVKFWNKSWTAIAQDRFR